MPEKQTGKKKKSPSKPSMLSQWLWMVRYQVQAVWVGFTGWGWPGDLWGWSSGQLAQDQDQDQD
jgi:hypothetical protein